MCCSLSLLNIKRTGPISSNCEQAWSRRCSAQTRSLYQKPSRIAEQTQGLPPDDDTIWQLNRLAPFAIAWRMAGNFPPMVASLQDMRKKTRLMQNHYLEAQSLWGLIIA